MMRRRYYVCGLLFLLMTVNYLDRSALSVAAKDVATEFHFSPVAMGYLFSAFVWTYALCMLFAGFIVDRFPTKWIQLIGGSIWSSATFLVAFATGFPAFVGLRMIMGAAEATSIPACNKIVREWIPGSERGVANTVFSAGSYAGPAIGAVVVGAVAAALGWRASFMVAGALSLLWLVPFALWFDRPERVGWLDPRERQKILAERTGSMAEFDRHTAPATTMELLSSPTLWALAVTQACAIYGNNVFLFWLPSYLQSTRGLTVLKTGLFTAVPYALAVPLTIAVGLWSDRVVRRGGGVEGGRRRNVVSVALLFAAAILAAPLVDEIWVLLALMTVSLTGIGVALALNQALLSDLLASPRNLGKVIGWVSFFGQLAGISAPIVSGYIIAGSGGYRLLFAVGGVLLLVGSTTCFALTRRPLLGTRSPQLPPKDTDEQAPVIARQPP
jgi:ACS family glucarate transporter-like MFS transporter